MILGVCSDNGYVQMLQPFQGNPQKMSKIILLASYNTTSDIQGLTYAIVQWPTVFRSQMASKTTCYGLAGVRTKDVTPLEDVLRIEHSSIPSSVERLTEVSVAPEIPRRKKGKKQSQIPPNAPQSPATRRVPVSTKFEVREPQSIPQRHGSRLDIQQDMRPCAKDRRRAKAKPLVDNIIPRSTPGLHMPSTSDLSEEPDHELTHPLDLPAPPRMPPRGPGTSILGLSSTLHGVLPFAASVARRVTCGATCPLLIAAPKLLSPVLKPQQSTKTDLDASTSDNEEPFGSSSDTPFRPQSFTHIPKPNRAESHIYDPDRFLYQQSPEYLQFNKAFLEEIIRYAKNHQATVPESQLRELKIRLQIAQFLLTRLTLALEIQSLEDEAAARGILWPLPSQDGRKDRFTSDWELYRKLSNRLDRGVREDVRLPQMTMESRLARLDYQNIAVI